MSNRTKTDLAAFYNAVLATKRIHPDWREGQAYYNTLAEMHPELAEEINGTDLDPFYVDSRIVLVKAYLRSKF